MGVTQWFDLLRRLRLCVFNHTYSFSNGEKARDWSRRRLADEVFGELLTDGIIFLVGSVNMRLPIMPFIAATGASTVFGIGGAIADADRDDIRNIARMACKSGGHVRLDDSPVLCDALAARLGPRYELGLSLSDFRVTFSVRIAEPGHINLEEARALVHLVRWVLRCKRRFCHRLVVLIDSKVVIGGVTKGRSFSVPLNALIRRLAALCFAGILLPHCVFVPTSHNPADWPSRGPFDMWPAALKRGDGNRRSGDRSPCPACGVLSPTSSFGPAAPPSRSGVAVQRARNALFLKSSKREWKSDIYSCMRRWWQADNTSEDFAAFFDDMLDNN